MDVLVPVLIIAALAVVVLAVVARGGKLGSNIYQRQDRLFSAAELRFLSTLDQAIAPGQRVFGKVRVADLVAIKPGLSQKARRGALNRIAQKHVDFVVCAGGELLPVCAIELNDSSHGSSRAKRRDELLASVCAQIELPLMVVKAAGSYSTESIRQQLAGVLQPSAQEKGRAGVA